MGLLRAAREPFPTFEALVTFHMKDGDLDALAVTCDGDDSMLKHLPPAFFDKILYNARHQRGVAQDLLWRATQVWEQMSLDLVEENVFVSPVPVYDGTEVPPDATVRVELVGALDKQRIGAVTRFHPSQATTPSVAESALWAIWDWTVGKIGDWEDIDVLVHRMLWQCSHYDGALPRIRDVGHAPFLSAEAFELLSPS